jgi:hypothetical protein
VVVAEQHGLWAREQPTDAQHYRIVEHELDMDRSGGAARPPIISARLRGLIRWLVPDRSLAGNHSRSIARELEEDFPSRDN